MSWVDTLEEDVDEALWLQDRIVEQREKESKK